MATLRACINIVRNWLEELKERVPVPFRRISSYLRTRLGAIPAGLSKVVR